jgi:hypothetical protein
MCYMRDVLLAYGELVDYQLNKPNQGAVKLLQIKIV